MNARAIPRLAPLRPDDRWRVRERGVRLSAIAVAILVGSFALHLALLAVAFVGAEAAAVPPREISVEVVQEAPKPAPVPAPKPAAEAPKPAPAPERHASLERQTPPAPKSTPAPEAPPAPPPQLRAATAPEPDRDERADLERELAELQAEQASIKEAKRALGPMRESIQGAVLPSATDAADGDAVSYQSLVFSALARAKEGIASKAVAGTVGIRFEVDEAGRLVRVAVAVSSGVPSLDEEALAIVRRASPFPKPPAGAQRVFSANVASAVVTR